MSGWQLSGDAPSAYVRYSAHTLGPWTDDLIRAAMCKTGDRVLDVACGTGFVACRVNAASNAECRVTAQASPHFRPGRQ